MEALINAFEHDRSAARGEMNARKLIAFKHQSHLGNARSGELFERIQVRRKIDIPRDFKDYEITIHKNDLPMGVEVIEIL
jgi:CRISPR-associated protein Csd2